MSSAGTQSGLEAALSRSIAHMEVLKPTTPQGPDQVDILLLWRFQNVGISDEFGQIV
jgi:hypothetical protein